MRFLGSTTQHCQNGPAYNLTQNWQVFFEDIGAGGLDNCRDFFYSTGPWVISEDTMISFEVTYNGKTGYTGQPQFQAYAKGMALNTGELYSKFDHAYAYAEADPGNSTQCPYLTYGPPYQHFGTDLYGNYDNGEYALNVQPRAQGGWENWPPTPNEQSDNPYWRSDVHEPDSFQTNGPSSSPK